MIKFLKSFKRITSSGNYIAEIDGLRFLAIFSVILFHCKGAFITLHDKLPLKYPQDLHQSFVYHFLDCGNQGVELFFAISGFILALPFITQYRYKSKELTVRKFYFRRLTRLEPPYILALLLLFTLKMLGKEYPFHVLFPSLLASMVYLHNIIYPGLPKITGLIWSLEVEVQFYLLTPFLLRIFLLPKNITRIILIAATLLMPFLQNVITTDTNSLFKFFQFFTVGILLADLYLDKTSLIHNLKGTAVTLIGIVFLFLLFG
jgi:peptidoglycan/LPS O-acetylase OafA/YrhL